MEVFNVSRLDKPGIGFLALLLVVLGYSVPGQAFFISPGTAGKLISPLIKHDRVLPNNNIAELALLTHKTGGTKEVAKIIGKLNLPESVIEDTYMRLAIYKKALTRKEAEGVMMRLRGTPGLRSTLSKITGNNVAKTAGHLNELRIADSAAQHGFRVKGIGYLYKDTRKSMPTDIDILLERNGGVIAVEAKDYFPTTRLPLDRFRADLDSLEDYAKETKPVRVMTVFSMTNKPVDSRVLKTLSIEAERRGVQLIFGNPEQQVLQLKLLQEIL